MRRACFPKMPKLREGFSLVELLVSIALLSLMMVGATIILTETQNTWTSTWSRTSQFRDARLAFELVTRNLSQASLNTYWDYKYDEGDATSKIPEKYGRKSELQFYVNNAKEFLGPSNVVSQAVFFQAILGHSRDKKFQHLEGLLNGIGYFIEYSNQQYGRPKFLSKSDGEAPAPWRFRLMEFRPPSEKNFVYRSHEDAKEGNNEFGTWFSNDLIQLYKRPVVDNVIALIVSPQSSPDGDGINSGVYDIAPQYIYDSQNEDNEDTLHLLPPLVEITLIAIDERTALYVEGLSSGSSPPRLLLETWFQEAEKFEEDLDALESHFINKSYNYRIFSTTVAIRSAKWSS